MDRAVYVCGAEDGSSRVEPGFIVVGRLGVGIVVVVVAVVIGVLGGGV